METGRSFTSLFPISQNQIILLRSQQVLRRQEQMRKKEVQLQNQLQCICQRQSDAHRRNQDLLRDFKRIEQELCLLTAKSDSFRRKQEKYKKQMHPFTPEQSKCAAPNSIASTMGHNYSKQFNDFSANYSNLCEPCHFSATVGHVGQPPIHFSLYPNQQLGLQGCCNRSLCCGLVHPNCDGQFGNFIPDVFKILDSTLDCQSQKKKCPTSDSSVARDVTFIPNTKKDIVQHCSGFVCDKDGSIKSQTMPTHVHGDPLQNLLNSDMYRDWKEKLLKDVQQQIVGEHAVEITLEQSKEEDSSKKQACLVGSPNSISEHPQQPLDALSKSHLPLVSPPAGDHNTKVGSKPESKRNNNKKLKPAYESTSYEVTAEQNIEDAHCTEQATSKVDHYVLKPNMKSSSASDSLVITGANVQTSNYKTVENSDLGMDRCEEEIKTIDSSGTESVCEKEIGYQDTSYLHQHEKEKDTRFMATFLKKSLEEFTDSSEEEIVLPKGSKMFHIVQENKSSSRCRTSEDEHSQEEASVSSHLSVKEKETTDGRHSAKEKTIEMGEHGLLRKMVQSKQSSCAGNSFLINEDKIKENMDLYMLEQEDESSDQSESQMKEVKCDNRNIGMLKGDSRLASSGLSENNIGDVYGVMGESERFRDMLTEEIEKSSSEEDKESEEKSEAESSVHEGVGIYTVKEKDIQRKVNEESENEDTGEDRTSGEDEISVNDSQGSLVVITDRVVDGITNEEESDIEADKENWFAKKGENQTECNAGSNIISEEEMSDKTDISDEEKLFSGDVSDEIESSEEEENTDFWGSRHEENDSDIEEMEQDVQLQSSSTEGSTKQLVNMDVSAREEDPKETVLDVPASSCQDLIEDEEMNSEKQSNENQPQGKRCSEDGSMDMLQMHPIEFGSSLPAEEPLADPIAIVHTKATPATETNDEDSDEESLHSEKESENLNQAWSDSEDNVHSFYD